MKATMVSHILIFLTYEEKLLSIGRSSGERPYSSLGGQQKITAAHDHFLVPTLVWNEA